MLLAFGSLLFVSPVAASTWTATNGQISGDCVQFDYRGGSASTSVSIPEGATNIIVGFSVNNTIDNKIGGGSTADRWSISANEGSASGSAIESTSVSFNLQPATTVNINISGIDVGYWGGWYGPTICGPSITYTEVPVVIVEPTPAPSTDSVDVPVEPTPEPSPSTDSVDVPVEPTPEPTIEPTPEPTIEPTPAPEPNWWTGEVWEGGQQTFTAPEGFVVSSARAWYGAPNDPNCGADVSATLTNLIAGQSSVTVNLDNGTFGDPCGGVVKVTRYSVTYVAATAEPAPVEPSPEPSPEPTQEPAPSPAPTTEPVVQPEPEPTPVVPVVPPVVEPPVIEPQPQPQPIPFPVEPAPEPTPPVVVEPTPEPVVTPEPTPEPVASPEPTLEPSPEPTPTESPQPQPPEEPQPTPEPTVAPEPEATPEPTLEPEPEEPAIPSPKPTIEPPIETVEEHSTTVVSQLSNIAPASLSDAQVAQLESAAEAILETAEQGSPAYEQALEALAIVAQADDAELPEELAVIPLLGDVAGAALEAFNAIGNIGADMSPKVREQAEDAVVASVIVGQVASAAAASAAVSASAASTRKIK